MFGTEQRNAAFAAHLSEMDDKTRQAFIAFIEAKLAHQHLVIENTQLQAVAYADSTKENIERWISHTENILKPSKQALGKLAYAALKADISGSTAEFREELSEMFSEFREDLDNLWGEASDRFTTVRESVSSRVASARNKLAGHLVTK